MRKVIVIGLDGGTFDILTPMIEAGELPALKRVTEAGVWGRLRTVIPPGTGPAWSTIATGLDPSNHGIFDLIVRERQSYNLAFLNGASLRAPRVWDMVGEQGGKVLVLNVPMTFPPRKVNGHMITGLLTPAGSDDCTYPPELLSQIRAIAPGYRINPRQAYVPGRVDEFLDELDRIFDAKAEVLRHLLARTDWTFAMQVFGETDFIQHALWHLIDPTHPRHNARDAARYGQRIRRFYQKIDGLVSEIDRLFGAEASIVVISDHGSGPLHEFLHANNLLLRRGLLNVRRSPVSRLKHLAFRAGLTPLNAYRFAGALKLAGRRMELRWTSKGYGQMSRLFFSFSDIDWERSPAYAISGGVFGAVFINLKGREPRGCVEPGAYDGLRDQIRAMLLGLRHPRTGGPLVREVLKREDVYGGRFLEYAPDLYFLPSEPTIAVFGDFEFSSNRVLERASGAISAQHRMDGVFIARGDGVMRGASVDDMRAVDVAPLLLYLMDLPIPRGLDGRLNERVLAPGETQRRPPAYSEPTGGADDTGPRDAASDQTIKERLRGLGYIS